MKSMASAPQEAAERPTLSTSAVSVVGEDLCIVGKEFWDIFYHMNHRAIKF